ncbi:DUF881 domain-containing protein [Actinopolymorpha pittospori]|uniref:Uncharacterized protein YlxW (UPF0749 family) n=1 Tax=Actinopolymorpha pittospori TaxID=648752 RepID=A0A927N847_9ACTN|nr:uncharacterized protein YlxW (UPF0749 family) [Actinopolymorpha pittospori]
MARGESDTTTARSERSAAKPKRPPVRQGVWPGAYPEYRRDDSMSLMRELVTHALDDGYAAAAARRGSNRTRSRRGMGATVLVLLVLGLLLTMAALQTRHSAPAVAKEKAELVVRIRNEAERNDTTRAQANSLQEEVTRLQNDLLASTVSGQDLRERLDALDVLAGTGRVEGPGLRLLIDDAPTDDVAGAQSGDGRILDIDLQQVVNGLWAAGAEAITVNGQRLTALTAIRGADKSITVDYRPLARPYVVEAIGNPDSLEARFTESPGGEWLFNLKAVHHIRLETKAVDKLTLPADSGSNLRYARTEGAQ